MAKMHFLLEARVSTDSPAAVRPVLERFVGRTSIKEEGSKKEFLVTAQMEGESAKDLNRSLLSALRKVEKKTRLHAEWTSGNSVEKFFDYVPKGVRKIGSQHAKD
jgi:hypothetical protein